MNDRDAAITFTCVTRIVVGEPPRLAERPFSDARIGFVHSCYGDTIRTLVFVPKALQELADDAE